MLILSELKTLISEEEKPLKLSEGHAKVLKRAHSVIKQKNKNKNAQKPRQQKKQTGTVWWNEKRKSATAPKPAKLKE